MHYILAYLSLSPDYVVTDHHVNTTSSADRWDERNKVTVQRTPRMYNLGGKGKSLDMSDECEGCRAFMKIEAVGSPPTWPSRLEAVAAELPRRLRPRAVWPLRKPSQITNISEAIDCEGTSANVRSLRSACVVAAVGRACTGARSAPIRRSFSCSCSSSSSSFFSSSCKGTEHQKPCRQSKKSLAYVVYVDTHIDRV